MIKMTHSIPSLTGIWHGLYSYPQHLQPVYFVATLISHGSGFSGSTHEALDGTQGSALTAFASVDGAVHGLGVAFEKTYDGSQGWIHAVHYEGVLNSGHDEVEGTWTLPGNWSGRFLMIRGTGLTETALRHAYETV
jgi:hypothetical protein